MIIISFPVLLTMAVIIGAICTLRGWLRNPMSFINDLVGVAVIFFVIYWIANPGQGVLPTVAGFVGFVKNANW